MIYGRCWISHDRQDFVVTPKCDNEHFLPVTRRRLNHIQAASPGMQSRLDAVKLPGHHAAVVSVAPRGVRDTLR